MSPDEIEGHINKICWGGRFAFVKDSCGEILTIIIKSLGLKDKNFVEFIYEESFKEAVAEGVSTKFDLQHDLKLKGMWDLNDNKKIISLKEKIEEIQKDIRGLRAETRAYKITEALLGSLKNQLMKKLVRRQELFGPCAENYAEETKSAAIVYCSTYMDNEEKYWPSYKQFLDEADSDLITNIVQEINKVYTLETKVIREIARAPSWRFRWNAGKAQGGLFERRLLDLDGNQQALIYWSQVYDSVYEAYEKPDDSVINDDEKLDKWFKDQDKKQKTEKTLEGKTVSGIKLSDRISQHGEIFVVANKAINPDAPDIQDIESLNPEYVRKFKRREQQRIKKEKLINEKELRHRRNKLSRKIIGSRAAVISKSSLTGKARGGKGAKNIVPGENIG